MFLARERGAVAGAERAPRLVPAFRGLLWLGDADVGTLLMESQVLLSLQLLLAI